MGVHLTTEFQLMKRVIQKEKEEAEKEQKFLKDGFIKVESVDETTDLGGPNETITLGELEKTSATELLDETKSVERLDEIFNEAQSGGTKTPVEDMDNKKEEGDVGSIEMIPRESRIVGKIAKPQGKSPKVKSTTLKEVDV